MSGGSKVLLAVSMAIALAAVPMTTPAAESGESSDPIRISLNDWTGQFVSSRIMGGVLEKAGYDVAYVQADYLGQFKELEAGTIDLAMEIWATTATEAMAAAEATGKVENLGPTGMTAKEDWWFPAYMVEACPGLPDWRALQEPACAEAFATAESAPKGFYLGGPADWGGFDPERIEALDLPFEMAHAASTPALIAALKAASTELKTKWPGAHKAIQAYTMSNAAMEAMLAEIHGEGRTVEAVVADWLAANEATWRAWID
ncbi:glycine betaine ABC transporter substrate-binding protein [Bauldia sp.]|uniref:glycine betaine ABC transporter substrate-binding protein n=1 Tax=Bauldia sp. TaxID=2575872 RepID=UPI003BAAAC9F